MAHIPSPSHANPVSTGVKIGLGCGGTALAALLWLVGCGAVINAAAPVPDATVTETVTEEATVTAEVEVTVEATVTAVETVTETVTEEPPPGAGGSGSGGSGGASGSGESAYYRNCDAARAAGAAPVRAGDPGYGSHLDRDGDGVGCE